MLTARRIAQLAQMACIWEACAPKPGNVSRTHDFPDASLEDFLISAIAIGPAFENAGRLGVGQTILQAVEATRQCVHSNTNLGLILLLAPLAKACCAATDVKNVRKNLSEILSSLTVEDAHLAYAAIRLARPGGMGQVSCADIAEEPPITLFEAMALARDRDSIAREYVTGFEITSETGLPTLRKTLSRGAGFSDAIVQTFLTILAQVPDTLTARKKGLDAALQVSLKAAEVLAQGGVFTAQGRAGLAKLDNMLSGADHALNPGTTADLTAAAVFLILLETAQIQEPNA